MSLRAQYPYSSPADVARWTQIALLIPVQRVGSDFIQPDSHFPRPVYPAIPTDQTVQKTQKSWLGAVETELAELDDLAEADGLPPVDDRTRAEAARILRALNPQPVVPVIYPEDGEVVIHFKAPRAPASVGIEIRSDGRTACYSHIGGRNSSAHFDAGSAVFDGFVKDRLRALTLAQ